MMSSMKSISTFSATPTAAPQKLTAYVAAVVAKLRDLAPYAAIILVVPGGSLMALLLWLYRRQKRRRILPEPLDTLLEGGRYI